MGGKWKDSLTKSSEPMKAYWREQKRRLKKSRADDKTHSEFREFVLVPMVKSIRDRVYEYLKGNQSSVFRIDHRKMAEALGLDYEAERGYLHNLAREWGNSLQNSQGLKGLNSHH
jgi:hypothetical protein